MSFNEVSHHSSIVHSYETKLKNAQSRIYEHENRSKACERCAADRRAGHLGCSYLHACFEKMRSVQEDLTRAKRNLREAQLRAKSYITDFGHPLTLISTGGERMQLERYACWMWNACTSKLEVVEVSNDLPGLKQKYGEHLRVFLIQEET